MSFLSGKYAVVTGASSGLGLSTALGLARLGASVAVVARDPERGRRALSAVAAHSRCGAVPSLFLADLSRQAEVQRLGRELVDQLPHIHVLVHNAGAMRARRELSEDGIELTLAVNHLAPFLLTDLLLPRLLASAPARVVTVAAGSHRRAELDLDDLQSERSYRAYRAYARSKLANVLFSNALAHRLAGTGVTSNSVDPGLVATGLARDAGAPLRLLSRAFAFLCSDAAQGARTVLHVAAARELTARTGCYFAEGHLAEPARAALDPALQRQLWEASARLVRPGAGHEAARPREAPTSIDPGMLAVLDPGG